MNNLIPYAIIAGKSIAVYIFIILAIRFFGKKELAQLSVIDLVFILLISNSVQNAMVGTDSSLPGGIAAALALFICNYIFKYFVNRSKRFSNILQGEKIVLVQDGQVLQLGMKHAMMSTDELERAVREHGVAGINEVDLAVLEVDGNISILSHDFKRKTVKPRKKMQLSHNP
jgi:uncharacterized membrane protein YcaP (DUF421 family)